MTRLFCLLAPVALIVASGCAHCGCGDPDPTPTHTFGRDGVVERGGGLRAKREYCAMCEWGGTKCASCRARDAAELAKSKGPQEVVVAKDMPKADADRMLKSLETKKIAFSEPAPEAKPAKTSKNNKGRKSASKQTEEQNDSEPATTTSPYAPLHDGPLMRTTR